MRILYGVVGEGYGHAIRSSVVIDHLLDQGHEVHLVASGDAVRYLEPRFGDVIEIWGLEMVLKNNEVSRRLTAAHNISGALTGLPGNVVQFFDVESEYDPDVVISDFETWSWFFGKLFGIPILCIDNIQVINRCRHDDDILEGERENFQLARSVVRSRTPDADWYLITTFFHPEITKKRTELVPPILRSNVLNATPKRGAHLLVYQTSETFSDLPDLLKELPCPVRAYGLRGDLAGPVTEENVTFKPFSDDGFVHDLATCRGVVASAGFTLISESLHLGKPYLATPVRGQFEQVMHARYVHKLGYGTYDDRLDRATLEHFLEKTDDYAANLQSYDRQDNSSLFDRLDELLDQAAADLI
jgi:uncharacterized protein (TIGR00661 family)